jgi:hypothetical protein
MNKQTKQLVVLGILVVLFVISYNVNQLQPMPPSAIKTKAAKAAQQDNLLRVRFHRVRTEMDGLYHYRIKPAPFEPTGNPFRITRVMAIQDTERVPIATIQSSNRPAADTQPETAVAESGDVLLAHAIAGMRFGGVVTMNDTIQLTVNGELHKEGDVFTTMVQHRFVLIRIKHLSTFFATLALDDPEAGTAEMRVRLK